MSDSITIYVDMDGVLFDFVGAACKIHNRSTEDIHEWDFFKEWGMSDDEFWKPIVSIGHEFWENLPLYPHAMDLLKVVEKYDPDWSILSSPAGVGHTYNGNLDYTECVTGKSASITKHFGVNVLFRSIFTRKKERLAIPGSILIDDNDKTVENFTSSHALGLLFPQKWNQHRDLDVANWITTLESALESVHSEE